MDYNPCPLNTHNVELPDSLSDLLEFLAENTHELWAQKRILEGWTYGPKRDDDRKEHPGLVPYKKLSESEKQYDRDTSSETLKAIILRGFNIIPREKTFC